MENVQLSRPDYDLLISIYSEWMRTEFLRFRRVWSLAGVRCSGSFSMCVELSDKLRNVK